MNIPLFLLLFGLISAVAIFSKLFRIPNTPFLVLTGTLVALWIIFPTLHFTPDLLLTVLLPPLLFEGSLRLSFANLKRTSWGIFFLAFPGVLISVFLVGLLFHSLLHLSWITSYLFAALLSATDPVAVLDSLKKLKIDRRLTTLLEGESLFNDGTAMVIFGIFLGITQSTATGWSFPSSFLYFIRVSGLGLMIGAILALLLNKLSKLHEDQEIRINLSLLLAYGSYILADHWHCSGILAVVAAGVVFGNLSPKIESDTSENFLYHFWGYASFIANSIVFLLIGTQVNPHELLGVWRPVLLIYASLMFVRLIIVAFSFSASHWLQQHLPRAWFWFTWWSGLRGALSLALAMSIAHGIPEGNQIYELTLGLVILFLFVNGFTTSTFAGKLKLLKKGNL